LRLSGYAARALFSGALAAVNAFSANPDRSAS